MRELLSKLLHSPNFGEPELKLFETIKQPSSLLGLASTADHQTLCAEAVELLQFRQREPSAERFTKAQIEFEPFDLWASKAEKDGELMPIGGVLVPLALLRPPKTEREREMECLQRAERIMRGA